MNIRIQANSKGLLKLDTQSDKIINKGLLRISKMCDILSDKFEISLIKYRNNQS